MRSNYILFFIIIVISSCKRGVLVSNSASFLKDSFVLENADLSLNPRTGSNICFVTDKNEISVWYFSFDKIFRYNILKKAIVDSITIPPEIDKANVEFYVDPNNKAYFLEKKKNSLVIADKASNKKVYFIDSSFPRRNIYSLYIPFRVVNNKAVLYKVPNFVITNPIQRKQYFSSKVISAFHIRDTVLIEDRSFSNFPKEYSEHYFDEFYPVAFCDDNKLYYCFSSECNIYVANLETGDTRVNGIRNLPENQLRAFDLDSISSFAYSRKYAIKTDKFVSLSHDVQSGSFLLLQAMGVKYMEDSLGHIITYEDKPIIVNVIDSNFNSVKRVIFDNLRTYSFARYLYYNSKMYLPKFNSRTLTIDVYEL